LGLRPRQGLAKVWAERRILGITFHVPKSVEQCEGMNPNIPKWAPTLGIGIPMDSQIFREVFQGS